MSEFDIVQAYYGLSSDKGPLMNDPVSVPAWEAVKGKVLVGDQHPVRVHAQHLADEVVDGFIAVLPEAVV